MYNKNKKVNAMNPVILTNHTHEGELLRAVFLPYKGMNLASYRKAEVEVIDQLTQKEFERRAAGLGCLIGPHFYLQREEWVVPVKDETLFPHIAILKAKGCKDPFSHGIGRYVPWNYKADGTSISAHISGKDTWNGIPLSALEGVDFTMTYEAELTPTGLNISMKVSSSRVSVIGLHYYYALPKGKATVTSIVKDQYNDMGQFKPIPERWMKNHLEFDLDEQADYGFLPLSEDHSGEVQLKTSAYQLRIRYQGANDEVSWQLYHPKNASFVCIEPMSAKNPRNLSASSSAVNVQIEIV
jgi:hypothetical protein